MTGKGHPLPHSDEARHDEIPEHLEREKGEGDDSAARVQPADDAVAPDGESYPVDSVEEDQRAHQDRGQSIAAEETKRP